MRTNNEPSDMIVDFLQHLPNLTPKQMINKLDEFGYIGQNKAKKSVTLLAYRHINRLKKIFLNNINPNLLPPKENALLLGQTGSGKTYLIELLFKNILALPTVIIDITSYSETGYIGQDVVSILTRLVHAAHGNYPLASIGIVCIDEFDKIASGKNNGVFSGQGTTKDVSGLGVQRELLKILENSDIDVPIELSHSSYSPRATMNTQYIPFIACGAFSNLKSVINNSNIGFSKNEKLNNSFSNNYQKEELLNVSNFQNYGLMPELIARFSSIISFDTLSKEVLRQILIKNTMEEYYLELKIENVELIIEDAIIEKIVDDAFRRKTGARGLRNSLIEYIEDACFELYSSPEKKYGKIHIYNQNNNIAWNIE